MTQIIINYKNNNKNSNKRRVSELLPTGNYEVIIENAQIHAKGRNKDREVIDLRLKVRSDLDNVDGLKDTNSKYHNRTVLMTLWTRKKDGKFVPENIADVLTAVHVPEGTTLDTDDSKFEEKFIALLENKPVKAYVKNEENTYKNDGSYRNNIAPWGLSETDYPLGNTENNNDDIEIKDTDLPF